MKEGENRCIAAGIRLHYPRQDGQLKWSAVRMIPTKREVDDPNNIWD